MFKINKFHSDWISDCLEEDLDLLFRCNLMDYSLLVIIIDKGDLAIEDNDEIEKVFKDPSLIRRVFRSENERYIYCIGLIDYLQKYNMKKQIEHKCKYIIHQNKASVADPRLYASRMLYFLNKNFLYRLENNVNETKDDKKTN